MEGGYHILNKFKRTPCRQISAPGCFRICGNDIAFCATPGTGGKHSHQFFCKKNSLGAQLRRDGVGLCAYPVESKQEFSKGAVSGGLGDGVAMYMLAGPKYNFNCYVTPIRLARDLRRYGL